MIDTELNAGTACSRCKKLGHWCRAVIAMDAIPYCSSCFDERECATAQAHRIRITGLGGEEQGTFSGPVRQINLSRAERKPFKDAEVKTAWRAEFERRSAEEKKKLTKPRPKPSEEVLAARRLRRREKYAAMPKEKRYVPTTLKCSCGRKMHRGNKYKTCWRFTQKDVAIRNMQKQNWREKKKAERLKEAA